MCGWGINQDFLTELESDSTFQKWQIHTNRMLAEFNLPRDWKGWSRSFSIRGVPSSMRCRALCDVAWGARPPEQRVATGWFVDLGQSVNRRSTWGSRICFRQNTVCFSFEEDRVLTAREMMQLQGFPMKDLPVSILPPAG